MAGGASSFSEDEMTTLSDINVVPLVDVVLVLLIVFMITVPAIVGSAPIKVDLPETNTVQMTQMEELPLHLFLRREQSGEIQLYMNDQKVNEASLRTALQAFTRSSEPSTYLAADKTIPWSEIVRVFDMLNGMGLHKFSLDTKHVGSSN